ncbi:hypothetical protein EDC04DRAFT_1052091 [Pisolithus marmoratus]|nr:hypothetical protein EDC04DRAFT_1052091 [Pisolithus marmoratus]
MPDLLHSYESSRQYSARDFLRIARSQAETTVGACHLYSIPSRSSCYHEFLLVHVDAGRESLMLIIERGPTNNAMRLMSSSGGVAKDTIIIMRAREVHEYWQSAGQSPVCKGTLRWDQRSPSLLDIAFIASAASTTFKHYNLYTRQCYWYARITLAAMARAFPFCSTEGTTSFSRRWLSVFGSYKPSQVQLLVDLHTIVADYLAPVVPTVEGERHSHRLLTPDHIFRGADITNQHDSRMSGGIQLFYGVLLAGWRQ